VTNAVLTRFSSQASAPPRYAPPRYGAPANGLEQAYQQPSYGGPTVPPHDVKGYGGGSGGGVPAAPARYMTLDDVIIRTATMLGVLLLAGAATWVLTPESSAGALIALGALGGLALALFMGFTMKANAVTALLYSALEGVALGAISRAFEQWRHGIVVQALTGTVMVAGGMLIAYRVGAIRVTPRFTKIVFASTLGVVGLMLVNLVAYLFHPGGLGLRDGGPLAILFSLLCIGIAAMNLAIDFEVIQQGIRNGADERFAWYASFGLMVTLVWLYLEILRLLGYLRE
jgi:uncharacterized YccA/Bax inhibitor family protein